MGIVTYISSIASKYGLAWIIVTQALAWITFFGVYGILYYYDLDVSLYLKDWGYDSPHLLYLAEKGGLFALSVALNRLLMPIRLGVSMLILPLIATPINRFLNPYWLYWFPPKSAPYKPQVAHLLSPCPSLFIVLMNIGFTGSQGSVDQDTLIAFLEHVRYKRCLMPHQPFSFIEFNNLNDAIDAFSFIKLSSFFEKEILLAYISSIPQVFAHNVLCGAEEIQEIKGLHYIPEYISDNEEQILLKKIQGIDSWIQLNHRLVKHYGYSYDYANEGSTKVEPFPDWIDDIYNRIRRDFPQFSESNQLTINCYQPGDGIGPHSDSIVTFQKDPIIVISLSSPIVMDFIKSGIKRCVNVERKSLLIMSQDARLDWQHGIRNRKIDYVNGLLRSRGIRISLTFRRV